MTDLKRSDARDWLVIGWFTPDYRPLARKFAANLDAKGISYHLFSRSTHISGRDRRRQKPSVVLEAMDAYPGKTLILMDIDCIVEGDLAPVTHIEGDVSLSLKVRETRKRPAKQLVLTAGSRVVVFRPTTAARAFVKEWDRLCTQLPRAGDELSMAWAFVLRPDVAYIQLDERYAGREVGTAHGLDNIIVWHQSTYGRGGWRSVKRALKRVEQRFFRTGRTKAALSRKRDG